ncbi:MAG: Spy/CpxP family protein refolding chaperone [Rhodospirillales bacterium]|nr:Spy/CpxP family protein refolding chaperone [Rhodospirillales bacterium]
MMKSAIPVLIAACIAGPALAQAPAPQAGTGEGTPQRRAMTHMHESRPREARGHETQGPMARVCGDADALLSARLAYMETSLKLKPEQMPAFDAFARDSRAAREPMKALCDRPAARPQRGDVAGFLATRERFAKAMSESLGILRPAVERFQAILDDAQKPVFARAFMMFRGEGGRAHGRH